MMKVMADDHVQKDILDFSTDGVRRLLAHAEVIKKGSPFEFPGNISLSVLSDICLGLAAVMIRLDEIRDRYL